MFVFDCVLGAFACCLRLLFDCYDVGLFVIVLWLFVI